MTGEGTGRGSADPSQVSRPGLWTQMGPRHCIFLALRTPSALGRVWASILSVPTQSGAAGHLDLPYTTPQLFLSRECTPPSGPAGA